MTNKDAVKYLTDFKNLVNSDEKLKESLDIAIKAIKSQIPSSSVLVSDDCYGFCECGAFVCVGSNYCSSCGQRIDWD